MPASEIGLNDAYRLWYLPLTDHLGSDTTVMGCKNTAWHLVTFSITLDCVTLNVTKCNTSCSIVWPFWLADKRRLQGP